MAITWEKIALEKDVIKHAIATAESDFLVASGAGAFVKKTLNETKTILGVTAGGVDEVARDNIVILAWKLAIANSLAVFNLEDGVVDEFEDETGVDTANSLAEVYNSTDDYYSPLAGFTIDLMEYSSNALAKAAYVSSDGNADGTGGTISYAGGYTIHTFLSGGTFTPGAAGNIEVLVVAGGGGGGGDGYGGEAGGSSGGGGAGGYIYDSSHAVTVQAYTVTVGNGGNGGSYSGGFNNGAQGQDSVFDTHTAVGGGYGGAGSSVTGGAGGSGGGSGMYAAGGAGTSGQGYAGGSGDTAYGAGGGGSSGVGSNSGFGGGSGGAGTSNQITGTTLAAGGRGGGGANGSANTGDGGGSGGNGGGGGNGGSGIVIIRYPTMVPNLVVSSENSIKTQGSYALKGVALITASLNDTLTRTIASPIDLTGVASIKFDIRSTRTGSNIKIGIRDSGGTITEITPNITSANTYQTVNWDISGVSDANKNVIDRIIVTIVNAGAENTFYVDNFVSSFSNMTLISNSKEAEVKPTNGRFLALVEPVDAITINTDVKGYISTDNGATYDEVTLTDEGYFDATKKIYTGNKALTDRSDKTMRQKLTTLNSKDLKVHAWGMLWS
jgi:hypothetical protein